MAALFPVAACAFAGCSTVQPPPPPPPPVAAAAPVAVKPDEWNIFPDPLSGRVEIYHEGEYLGAITGNETEDPPMPHKDPNDPDEGGEQQ